MVTIGVDKLLSNSALYEHRYLEIIQKLYKAAVKDDNKQKLKTSLNKPWYTILVDLLTTVQ